jgi:hypothetical protein
MKVFIFWDMTPCRPLEEYRQFRRPSCIHQTPRQPRQQNVLERWCTSTRPHYTISQKTQRTNQSETQPHFWWLCNQVIESHPNYSYNRWHWRQMVVTPRKQSVVTMQSRGTYVSVDIAAFCFANKIEERASKELLKLSEYSVNLRFYKTF